MPVPTEHGRRAPGSEAQRLGAAGAEGACEALRGEGQRGAASGRPAPRRQGQGSQRGTHPQRQRAQRLLRGREGSALRTGRQDQETEKRRCQEETREEEIAPDAALC